MDKIDTVIVILYFGLVSLGLIIFLPIYFDIQKQEKINNTCSYIFNPATSLSNYTSYKHCILYPKTYGVEK